MLIRSQNNMCVINLDNIDTIYYSERDNCIKTFNGESETNIGNYSTKEKAMKVLDTIQRFHTSMWGLENGFLTLDDIHALETDKFTDFDVLNMPEDSEVE